MGPKHRPDSQVAALQAWEYVVGTTPHKVWAYEDLSRKGMLYLKWLVATASRSDDERPRRTWRRRSLGFLLRDAKGKVLREHEQRARAAAEAQYRELLQGPRDPATVTVRADLSIAEGWALGKDPDRGRWNKDTPHRREMDRVMQRVKSIWGARRTWNSIGRGELRMLWRAELRRQRALGHAGARSAEIIMARVLALASWLRDEQHIAPTAALPWKRMKEEMAGDIGAYKPTRPRYNEAEYRAILPAAWEVDPRFGLLLEIGAEYRLGLVRRVHRSHVRRATVEHEYPQPDGTLVRQDVEVTLVLIPGSGRKKGATVELTPDQERALWQCLETGHLAALERAYQAQEIADYPLFGGGRMIASATHSHALQAKAHHATRAPLDNTQLRKWLRATEAKARVDGQPIEHVEGRGWYGLRRIALDLAKKAKISRDGMVETGGWADPQTPDTVYADEDKAYARTEAASVRARIRKGDTSASPAQPSAPAPTPHSNDASP